MTSQIVLATHNQHKVEELQAHPRRRAARPRGARLRRPGAGRGRRHLRRERADQGARRRRAHRTAGASPTTPASASTCSAARPASSPRAGPDRRKDAGREPAAAALAAQRHAATSTGPRTSPVSPRSRCPTARSGARDAASWPGRILRDRGRRRADSATTRSSMPDGHAVSAAELPPQVKNAESHRAIAFGDRSGSRALLDADPTSPRRLESRLPPHLLRTALIPN